jgi:hypothetical protein
MLMAEIKEEMLKLADFYQESNSVLENHIVGDDLKEDLNSLMSKQSQLSEKLTKAAQEMDYVFNASFYADDLSSLYKKLLIKATSSKKYHELALDLQSFANIHMAQADQLVTIHELMSSSDSFNN